MVASITPDPVLGPVGQKIGDVEPEPSSHAEVLQSVHREIWEDAEAQELGGLKANGTFTPVTAPPGRSPIGARWVYKWKSDGFGEVTKAKARLVAKGFSQKPGVDYDETFAPTPASPSIRLLVATAVEQDFDLFHFDAEQAFVQSDLDNEIYMRLPPGCGDLSGKVVLLHKSLYGLKQASRTWNKLLVSRLKGYGFEQCKADPCIFRLMDEESDSVRMMLAAHVDDMVLACKGAKECESLRAFLSESFPTNNLGKLRYYTGCSFKRDKQRGTLTISQAACVNKLLERFNITTTSPIPASPSNYLRPREETEAETEEPFREAVGSLMWVANMTRPDILNAVREVARHSHSPSDAHWKAVNQILRYLKGTSGLGLTFRKGASTDLITFADADYARNKEHRRSVSGGVIMYLGAAIAYISRTQRCVSLSSTEAEYIAMGDGVKELLFVRQVLRFLRPGHKEKRVTVFEDNEGAISLASNRLASARSKHIDVRYHFLRELVEQKQIAIVKVKTERQRADILTKALGKKLFFAHRNYLLNERWCLD